MNIDNKIIANIAIYLWDLGLKNKLPPDMIDISKYFDLCYSYMNLSGQASNRYNEYVLARKNNLAKEEIDNAYEVYRIIASERDRVKQEMMEVSERIR